MQTIVITILLFVSFVNSYSQTTDTLKKITARKNFCLLTGAGYSQHPYVDLGISVNQFTPGRHPFASAYFVSSEFHFANKPIIGPKLGAWGSIFPMVAGLNAIYYTDFDQHSFVVSPEFGMGLDRSKSRTAIMPQYRINHLTGFRKTPLLYVLFQAEKLMRKALTIYTSFA